MTAILITGANKGLGLETARQLAAAGHKVWLGSRDADRGRRAAAEVGAVFVQLDVTDDASVAAAADAVAAGGGLDVLVNNAGVQVEMGPDGVLATGDHTGEVMRTTLDTNVVGPVRVLHAFLPLLQRSASPVVVNVSSGLASLTHVSSPDFQAYGYPGVAYPTSKAALNMTPSSTPRPSRPCASTPSSPVSHDRPQPQHRHPVRRGRRPRHHRPFSSSSPTAPPAATSTPTAPSPG
ncbi:LOW QUALITY PROTEIN: short-chain dehydrogenase, partial [Kutzneria sp. 744]